MFNILNLVDEHGEIITYSPTLAHQVAEIAAAIRADREANLRRALASVRPQRAPVVIESMAGHALVTELWPGAREGGERR